MARQRPRPTEELAAPAAAPERPPPVSPPPGNEILQLQRSAGNAAVARLLARQALKTPPAPAPFVPKGPYGEAFVKARAERDAFVKAGKKGPVTYNPSASNKENYYGGFDVEYDPKTDGKGELKVILKGACEFLPGIVLNDKGLAVAKEPSPQTAAAAQAINKLKKDDRPAEVAKWKWSKDGGAEAGDEATFKTKFADAISSGWRKKHEFVCERQWWEDVGATVDVSVQVTDGPKAGTDHMTVKVYKVPPGYIGGEGHVSRSTGKTGTAFDNTMQITSVDVDPRGDDQLRRDVSFEKDKNTITAEDKKRLAGAAKRLPNAPAGATIAAAEITATVQGADDAARQARFEAIVKVLTDGGVDRARLKFVAGGTGDSATLIVGTGARQTVAAHEAGHMFGLDDEYVGTGAYAPGKKTEHTDFAAKEGFTGAQHAVSDAIMAGGREVRPHHYVTFLDSLRLVTGIKEWGYGAPREVTPPTEIQDYPTPDPNATTALA